MGHHVLLNLYECGRGDRLEYLDPFEGFISDLLSRSGAEVVDTSTYQFQPRGYTLLSLLTTSHFSIHTWPEHRSAAVDIFTCGAVDTGQIVTGLIEFFDCAHHNYRNVLR
jgi:S-adenosylmethionine decarboxylase proenzyme